ncbi:MAG: xanthine dehydrogenase family protein molybdopterin-binding subunit [Calditrichaceae bacterium]
MAETRYEKSKIFIEEEFEEKLAEVPADPKGPWPDNDKLKIIGKSVPRSDGYDKVSGTAAYTFDIALPRMTHARILRSPLAHAKIKKIDTGAAKKLKGVLAVLSSDNSPDIKWFGNSALFDTHLRYEGDEVACVVAESDETALKALKLIKVEYDELPFVIDAKEAMEENAPKIQEDGNIQGGKPFEYARGDIEEGFSEADGIIEETFETQVAIHNPTEVHCSVANWDGDRLTVWDSTQAIHNVRDRIAEVMDMPASRVRVIKKYMGGGFGSKLECGKYSVMASILARQLGRPVKIVVDRKEMNLAVGNRPNSVQKLKLAAKKDGTLTAISHYSYGAIGGYEGGAGCSWPARQMYKCENVKVEEYSVFTNTGPTRPFRAPGYPQGFFALDSAIDMLAEQIGMDPLEFRMKNNAERHPMWNAPYTSKLLSEAYEKGAKAIGWDKRNKIAGSQTGPVKTGMGMGSQVWWGGGGPPAHAVLKLNRDGSARVLAGTQDIGTGTYTFMAMVVSEVLDIPMNKIEVILGDTAVGPYCPVSGGSLTAPSVSPAVRDAAENMKIKLINAAAAQLESNKNNLVYAKGVISDTQDNDKKLSIPDLMEKMNEQTITTTGSREANPEGYIIQSFGAQFAKVEVDTLTGKIRVEKIVAAHDIGRVLNRKTLNNQFHGGIMQGLSYALMEERVVDPNTGKVVTTNLHDYKMPIIADTPEIEVIIVSEADPMNSNTGVKGCGEPAIIPTAAAIANAVYNATGVRVTSLPMTPDKVLMALNQS